MADEPTKAAEDAAQSGNKRFEGICGLLIATLAAILAITDLGAGKYGDDELIAHNEKNGAYLWYQAKGIKETQVEGQRDVLRSLVDAGSIRPEQLPAMQGLLGKLDEKLVRYGKEKKEILLGSQSVGRENWAQDVGGEMGKVTGAKEWESKAMALNDVGDTFDYATFFLQLCLVFGAISLILESQRLRVGFLWSMVLLGLVGAVLSAWAFNLAAGVP